MKPIMLFLALLVSIPSFAYEQEHGREPAAISQEDILAGGGETSYEVFTVAVQDEHRGEVPQDENLDFFDP